MITTAEVEYLVGHPGFLIKGEPDPGLVALIDEWLDRLVVWGMNREGADVEHFEFLLVDTSKFPSPNVTQNLVMPKVIAKHKKTGKSQILNISYLVRAPYSMAASLINLAKP